MKKGIYGYARVSTKGQCEDRQVIALINAGVSAQNIFLDKMSGKDFERPQYLRLLDILDNHSVLFIKSIDRLGRNYTDLNNQWRIITKEIGADIVVIDMPILDTRKDKNLIGTFISDIVLTLLSYVAENERINIRQRQSEGIAAAKIRGVHFGRPRIELPDNFKLIYQQWKHGKISLSQGAEQCNMPKSTFYSYVKYFDSL